MTNVSESKTACGSVEGLTLPGLFDPERYSGLRDADRLRESAAASDAARPAKVVMP